MNDEAFRNVAASSMAHGFVIEILLARYLRELDEGGRRKIADSIIKTGQKTDQLFGVAKDEEMAELLSDVTVRMHGMLETLVERAMSRLA